MSASKTGTPIAAKTFETVDFPAPMLPVKPILSILLAVYFLTTNKGKSVKNQITDYSG
jgi:hypothetical protein